MRILFVADVVGRPGRKVLKAFVEAFRGTLRWDLLVANGENAAGGFGITEGVFEDLLSLGVDVVTSGNHVWDRKEVLELISREERFLRPANFPPGAPGNGFVVLERLGLKVGVLNLQGRVYMSPLDCPFRVADEILAGELSDADVVVVDFHAEATSEKKALGLYLDGRVSAVLGTHTHVMTRDETILPGGTAFMTDVGMTGGHDGIIGMRKETVLDRFLLGMPTRMDVCEEGLRFNGVLLEVDGLSGRATSIKALNLGIEEIERGVIP